MTDKEQIIIDNVNVRNCDFFLPSNKYCGLYSTGCRFVPNCYFKQLQKEKFENLNNRQMVENAENLIYENSELYKNLKEKEQECEELKLKCLGNRNDYLCERQVTKRYRKALDEIGKYYNSQNLKYDYTACDILSIIKKVKGD